MCGAIWRAAFAIVVLLAQSPASAQSKHLEKLKQKRILALPSQKDVSLYEIVELLDTTPPCPFSCSVGELWPAFERGAPHNARVVRDLLTLFGTLKDHWKRFHILSALSYESDPRLRGFWVDHLEDPKLSKAYLWPVIKGLGRVGTDDEVLRLAPRLGESIELDQIALYTLGERRMIRAIREIEARFRDSRAGNSVRWSALMALEKIAPKSMHFYWKEALEDPDGDLRKRSEDELRRRAEEDRSKAAGSNRS